jgi:type IV secretion system protein VirD4
MAVIENEGLPVAVSSTGEIRRYDTDMHRLVVAPTRSGKGTGTLVPMLLEPPQLVGSALVVDIKGELAAVTGGPLGRGAGGCPVHIFDPFALLTPEFLPAEGASSFNPIEWLTTRGDDIVDDAAMIAEALISSSESDGGYWVAEGRALLTTFLLWVALDESCAGNRNLFEVLALLNLPPEKEAGEGQPSFEDLVKKLMLRSPLAGGVIQEGSASFLQKAEKERSGVLSTAKTGLHWLRSGRIKPSFRRALTTPDDRPVIDFARLKSGIETIYLVIPAPRLGTHGGLLRLMVMIARACLHTQDRPVARSATGRRLPVRFVLDEFAALGRMHAIEQGFGLDAGFGIQHTVVIQNFSQLEKVYDKAWRTFLNESGIMQAFAPRDTITAEELSKLTGTQTMRDTNPSSNFSTSGFSGGTAQNAFGRPVMLYDDIMRMGPEELLLFLPHRNPARGRKLDYRDTSLPYAPRARRNPYHD